MPGVSFDRAANYYDATRGYTEGVAERIRDALTDHIGATVTTRFLELGVGTGRIALPFIQAGYNYTGIDLSRAMLNVLQTKLRQPGAGVRLRAWLCQADVTDLPFAAATFEVILGVHVLHLVNDWQQALREARRVLHPSGAWMILGYDEGLREPGDLDRSESLPPPLQAQKTWNSILKEMGYGARTGRSRIQISDERLHTHFHELGATTEAVCLTTYARPAISARDVVNRYRERIYSSDWNRPDDIHNEAIRRIERWLATECAAPDEPATEMGQFTVLIAHWD
ncbi:MAG: class I SAM-dependent methyltransferase [Chloroflexales bacterium]|nr:class I SAM-dependent methyltransferase [Chloroflexales bacterium]